MQDIGDNEIRFIGGRSRRKKRGLRWLWVAIAFVAVAGIVYLIVQTRKINAAVETYIESELPMSELQVSDESVQWKSNADPSQPSCVEVYDTIVDGMHLRIYTPYNTLPELHIGMLDTTDSDIILTTMAADLRLDNGKIVGAFVMAGEPMSWGQSKRGYCAIINGCISIGSAENSPLFEQSTEQGGYFFRQYAAVANGVAVANKPQNASYRRALCVLDGMVCMVRCTDRVLMNDFSEALVDLGVSEAILLVGGNADGWCRTSDGKLDYFGILPAKEAEYMNYIVFRKQ